MNEQSLFDPEEGRARRDEAIAKVEEHAEPSWIGAARGALIAVATKNRHFTADDVAEELASLDLPVEKPYTIRTHEPRAMGAIFLWAKREKIAEPTSDFVPTRRAQGHAGPRRVWKSLVI